MAIFVDASTKVIVQGLTGGQGKYHGLRNRAYGTQVVAGVTPGKGGQDVEGVPVFDTVADAVTATGANASFIAVPPKAASAAILEAAAAGIGFIVCITEGIPAQDEAKVFNRLVRDFFAGATLSAGTLTDVAHGTWTLSSAQLAGLTLTPAAGSTFTKALSLVVTATATDHAAVAVATSTLTVTVSGITIATTSGTITPYTQNFNSAQVTVTGGGTLSLSAGTLALADGTAITVDSVITAAQLGSLSFRPDAYWSGTATFKWRAFDSGAIAGSPALASNEATTTLTV